MDTPDVNLVRFVVEQLVENPSDIQLERSTDEKGVLVTLTVNPKDLGRVIGKEGVTAEAIRRLLRALGMKHDARYSLKINDMRE